MVRILGALLTSLAVWSAGLLAVKRRRLRLRQLSQCVELIQTIAVEIRYGSVPVKDILRNTARSEAFRSLDFLSFVCEEELTDFSTAWQKRIEADASLALRGEEKAVLIRFGQSLGTTDAETQLLLCERFRSQLAARLEAAAARQTEAVRLILGGSTVSALILFALIL